MTTTTASPLTSGDLDASGALVRPVGPFSLDTARRSVTRWGPLSRHGATDGPVRIAAIADTDHTPFAATLTEVGDGAGIAVEITVEGVAAARHDAAVRQVARMFSLDHDARGLADVLRSDPAVTDALRDLPGVRPVLFPSPYEAAAWAVISPRIGKAGAAALQRRLAAAHGLEIGGVAAFPTPEALRRVEDFPGLPEEKLRRLHGVADAALAGDLDVHRLRALGPDEARVALRGIRGIGPFWASGIWLRACGVVDEWPDEPHSTAILARLHGRDADAEHLTDLVEPLAPFRTWVAFALRMSA